jgi:hypothetical protein
MNYSLLLLFSMDVVICNCLSGSPVGLSLHFNCCGLLAKLFERVLLINLMAPELFFLILAHSVNKCE